MIVNEMDLQAIRSKVMLEMKQRANEVVDICSTLLKIPTENPPSDTREIALLIGEMVKKVGAEVFYPTMEEPIVNVVAKLKGNGPGKRLIFNGHLDTFPAGDLAAWSVDPFAAVQKDGRLYGRGASDMKGGVASSIFAFLLLAEFREYWSGEIVLVLVGDEESGGTRGTEFILETVPDAMGDVMIKGDAGSPMVLRFGEKGPFWIELVAEGVAAHGAHLYRGDNAIEKLIVGMVKLKEGIEAIPVETPESVLQAIVNAGNVSEQYSGKGETEAIQKITVNFGVIEGGIAPNLVPALAKAKVDIRLPVGVTSTQVEQVIKEVVESTDGLSYNVLQKYESNCSDVNYEIFPLIAACGFDVMGETPVMTIRVGASDARMYRERGVPAVNCGLTPYNMGGPDEYIEVAELLQVAKIHTLAAFDYLVGGGGKIRRGNLG